jgi:hypothetical protein
MTATDHGSLLVWNGQVAEPAKSAGREEVPERDSGTSSPARSPARPSPRPDEPHPLDPVGSLEPSV